MEQGFDAERSVGCSDYKMDLAVRHPKLKGIFVMGIECDGPAYDASRTARERDRLRKSVLEAMGWRMYRIWSTDWIKDTAAEKKRLVAAIEKSIEEMQQSDDAALRGIQDVQHQQIQDSNAQMYSGHDQNGTARAL